MPKISVIIPTYNRANLLPRAIKSVLNQTFKDFELIIVDDCSTDNTKEIIKGFQKQDSRIKLIILEKNSGAPAHPKNIGIKEAKGKFVAFLDSDDEWLPEKLNKQLVLFGKNKKLGFVSCNAFIINKRKNKRQNKKIEYRTPRSNNYFISLLETDIICSSSSVVIRKDILDEVGCFDNKIIIGEDQDMWIRISQKYDFDFVSEPLLKYYIHQNNTMKIISNLRKAKDIEYIFQKYKKYYEANSKLYSIRLRYEGTRYMLAGEREKGRKCFIKSIKKNPFNAKSYLYFLLSFGGKNFYYNLAQIKARFKKYKIFNRI